MMFSFFGILVQKQAKWKKKWNRPIKSNIKYWNGYKIEPTDVTDKVLWTFQATHYTMASKVKNRWGGWFAAWKKDPNIRDVYVYLHNTRDAVANFALLYPCTQRASLTSRKGHRCVRGHWAPLSCGSLPRISASCMNPMWTYIAGFCYIIAKPYMAHGQSRLCKRWLCKRCK